MPPMRAIWATVSCDRARATATPLKRGVNERVGRLKGVGMKQSHDTPLKRGVNERVERLNGMGMKRGSNSGVRRCPTG